MWLVVAPFLFIYYTCIVHVSSVEPRPNIIIIYTDNQDLMLGSPDFMPILQSQIVSNGKTFSNAFVNTPICCPSRAELLSGRYFHNNGAPNGTCMSINAYNAVFDETNLFQKLYNNGYKTGAFGKIMNEVYWWCNTSNPNMTGFSRLYIPCNYLDYYGDTYLNKFMNGTWEYSLTNISHIDPSLYQTSQIGNATIDWIHDMYNNSDDKAPFFALWGVHAPHMPATPAKWYSHLFNDSKAPRTSPAFNKHYNDKHWMVANEPFVDENAMMFVDQLWRDRLRSMLSVDDFIYALFDVLTLYDLIDNTYIFYTSDHGYHSGQWQLPFNMRQPYDTDIRVPFYVFGPNITADTVNDKIISNVDIAPTVYELVGIPFDRDIDQIDGVSFAKYLFDDADGAENDEDDGWRDVHLTEFRSTGIRFFSDYWIWFPSNDSFEGVNINGPKYNLENGEFYYIDNPLESSYRSIRILNETHNLMYAEFVGYNWTEYDLLNPLFYEMYNVANDPWQTQNIYNQTDTRILNELHEMLLQYAQCKGSQCP